MRPAAPAATQNENQFLKPRKVLRFDRRRGRACLTRRYRTVFSPAPCGSPTEGRCTKGFRTHRRLQRLSRLGAASSQSVRQSLDLNYPRRHPHCHNGLSPILVVTDDAKFLEYVTKARPLMAKHG